MFFMVSEIEVYATGESAEGGDGSADTSTDAESSAAESSEPEDSSTAAVSSEAAASSPPLLLRRPPRIRVWLRPRLLRLPLWQVPPSFSARERKRRRKPTGRHSRYMGKRTRSRIRNASFFLRAYSSICLDRKSAPAASSFLSASSSGRSPLSTASRAPAMSPSETMG